MLKCTYADKDGGVHREAEAKTPVTTATAKVQNAAERKLIFPRVELNSESHGKPNDSINQSIDKIHW